MKRATIEEGYTHAERMAQLDTLMDEAYGMPSRTPNQRHAKELACAHVGRLRLIYKPFPVVLRRQSAMIHSGTIVGDTFYGNGDTGGATRKHRDVDGSDWANHAYIRESEAVIA